MRVTVAHAPDAIASQNRAAVSTGTQRLTAARGVDAGQSQ